MAESFSFRVTDHDATSQARRGIVTTPHGSFETPAFLPVGTVGSVKGIGPEDLRDLGAGIVLMNAYHLSLRPGEEVIAALGGVHRFTGWGGPVLTDSGGYQVMSLSPLRRVEEDGVRFRSHLDGSERLLTPETVVEIQRRLRVDIAMVLDECVPLPSPREEIRRAADRTRRWAGRAREAPLDPGQALFGIVQGGPFEDLREESARAIVAMGFEGHAIGGLAVGESRAVREQVVKGVTAVLPPDRPRYLMGVGTLADILDAVRLGVDFFDCVLPTRNARNGQVFTFEGPRNLRNARYARDPAPIDPLCACPACRGHSRAYLRHLFLAREMLGPRLATLHNLFTYLEWMRIIRGAIGEGTLASLEAPPDGRGEGLEPGEAEGGELGDLGDA